MLSPKRYKKQDLLDDRGPSQIVALFDRKLLVDDIAVEIALSNFERLLYGSAVELENLPLQVESVPFLLDFILCGVSDHGFETLETAIFEGFPTTADSFCTSAHAALLARLCKSLLLPYARVSEAPPEFIAHQKAVESAASLLQDISLLRFPEGDADNADGQDDPRRLAKRKAQARRRSSAASVPSPVVERASFFSYGVRPPTTQVEATDLAAIVLNEQRGILQFYLRAFRREPHRAFSRAAYLPQPSHEESVPVAPEVEETPPCTPSDEAETSPTRPLDQPLTVSLYFEGIESFGEWQILTSQGAQRDLRKARKEDAKKFKMIVKKIRELSHGHFSDDNHKKLTGLNVGVPVFEAKMSRDLRLVYQIHCAPDVGTNVERQVICISGIYTHAQLDGRFWDAMSRTLAGRGPEYRKRCLFRNRVTYRRGDNVVLPGEFPPRDPESETVELSQCPTELSDDQMKELRSLVLEGYVKFSKSFLHGILADQDVAHVFNVSQREKDIIEHPHSCIVIGRSGTGKTTTILFKMLGIERSSEALAEGMAKPRQLFVTQSRVLAEKVEEYYGKLQQSLATAKCSPAELKEMAAKGTVRRQEHLVYADEEVYWRSDLPKRYGALENGHFPMFLTYDHLCRLIESEFATRLAEADKQQAVRNAVHEALLPGPRNRFLQRNDNGIINYKVFLGAYWSHFPQDLIKGLDAEVVFSEFLGVIQGSEEALKSQTGHLSRDAYCAITRRTLITDTAKRGSMYDLFLLYRKKKKQLWHRDAADRTFELVQALRKDGLPGPTIDFLYVDEAQDNLLIDAFVLRSLCPNPRGMFWAGDTAQTISAGSTFRFSELKAFLHNFPQGSPGTVPPPDPKMFHLTANYRSHAGIVDCAASVVQLITSLWPDSVDVLPPEKGMTVGPKPIFFWGQRTKGFSSFLSEDTGSNVEFGAHQCILVRDEAAKERLRSQEGQIGIVLTIAQSKGLEFDDVLLYDPFEDSPEDYQQWRVILNKVPGFLAPHFDEARHSGICRELKFLYVGITRARMNLWIMDSSSKGEPMRRFWTHTGLVESHAPGTAMPRLAVSSGTDEWAEVARSLFDKQQYAEAGVAFERAHLPRKGRVAHAYHLRDVATASSWTRDPNAQSPADLRRCTEVATAFVQCAAEAVDAEDRQSYYRTAGQYYALAGRHHAAARSFYDAGFYEDAAVQYRAAGMFDEAVDVVQHRAVDASVAESIISVAKLQFIRENEIEKACALFNGENEALDYMASYGLEAPRASLLEQVGNYSEAAESQLSEGNITEAIRLFLLDGHNPGAVSRAAQSVLDGLWSAFSFNKNPTPASSGGLPDRDPREVFLRLSETLDGFPLDDDVRNEIAMFRAISRRDAGALLSLRRSFSKSEDEAALFLCLDKVFSKPPELGSLSPAEIASCFRIFLVYARTMQRLVCFSDPCNHPVVKRLFTLTSYDDDHCLLHEGSDLVDSCAELQQRTDRHKNGWMGVVLLRRELEKRVKDALKQRLSERVLEQNELCHQLRSIRPCFLFATTRGRCPRGNQCANYHPLSGSHSRTDYNLFVRIHILQIMIYHTLYATNIDSDTLFRQQRNWLRRLYEALYPPHFMLGAIHLLSTDAVPELEQGRRIITVWIRDFLNALQVEAPGDPWTVHVFRTNLIRATRLAMLFDCQGASTNLHRIPCMFPGSWPQERLWEANGYQARNLVRAMQSNERDSLDRGVLFLNHVLSNRLTIDINVLCDFMDLLCGSLIAAKRLRTGRSLHDVTLPKSWLARVVAALPALEDKTTRRAVDYKSYFKSLLRQVYSGRDSGWHLYFENLDLSRIGAYKTRNILVARICRNLCLWGYNLRSPELRQEILTIISSIGQQDCEIVLSPVISPYIYATSWNGLAKAVRASTAGSDLDEMVQLWHKSIPMPRESLPHVRRVPFARHSDISALPDFMHPYVSSPTVFTADNQTPTSSALFGPPPPIAQAPSSTGVEDVNVLVLDDDDASQSGRASPVLEEEEKEDAPVLSSEELAAATIIADAFKRYRKRVQVERDALQEAKHRTYTQFRVRAQKTPTSTTLRWRILFLGSLPSAYFALECTKNHLSTAITETKDRLKHVNHRELETLLSTLEILGKLLEGVSLLHQQLEPAASFYDNCDVERLKTCVLRADELVRAVAADARPGFAWQTDMDLARQVAEGV